MTPSDDEATDDGPADGTPIDHGPADAGPADDRAADDTEATSAERACFEAGVKFGSLYHQFAGTPVSPDSAHSLERAIEAAIENQPYCESVAVDIDVGAVERASEHGYTELTGRFVECSVVVDRAGVRVTARMAMEDGYPLMGVASVER